MCSVDQGGAVPTKNARRLLLLIYSMANGRTDVALHKQEIVDAADRVGLYRMSDEEFETFRETAIARVKATRAARNS